MERLNNMNYFSSEHNWKYTGSSQIKDFIQCEAYAMAKLKGEWIDEISIALKQSSYVDAWMSKDLKKFKKENPDLFLKNGELKSEFRLAEEVINQIKKDPMFMKYIGGKHQKIMTGTISNIPVKIKIDSLHDSCLVDLKVIKSLDLIWDDKDKCKKNFIDYYRYTLQAALYQEIVRQKTGKKLPFIIAVVTKEKYSQRQLLQIPQEVMDRELEFLKQYLPHLQDVKTGKVKPTSCDICPYCISKKKCEKVVYYDDFFNERSK